MVEDQISVLNARNDHQAKEIETLKIISLRNEKRLKHLQKTSNFVRLKRSQDNVRDVAPEKIVTVKKKDKRANPTGKWTKKL